MKRLYAGAQRFLLWVCVWACIGGSAVYAQPIEPRVFKTPPKVPAGSGDSVKKKEPKSKPFVFEIGAEYRMRWLTLRPLDVSGLLVENMSWGEQRVRLDMTLARPGLGALFLQIDALDGVLLGDNGSFGKEPEVSSGLGISSKRANRAGWRVALLPGADPFEPNSYVPALTGIQPLEINYAYGEVNLPFGVIRFGRQPIGTVGSVSLNDGMTGRNRWGVSWYHQSADRVLFGTKLSEVIERLRKGSKHVVDRSMDRGLFFGFAYDFLVQDELYRASDDLQSIAVQLDWRVKDKRLLGIPMHQFRLTSTVSYRWEERYNTGVFGLPVRLNFDWGNFRLSGDVTFIEGSTRELSAGFSELTGRPVVDQKLSAWGARVSVEGKIGPVTLVGEWAYASGDDDPRPETPMTLFSWPRDTNLGLMLFEHTLAFQTARSAQVGIQNLKQLEAESFPLTELATEGRVTNVNAFFPQIFYDPLDSLRLKFGALFAWSASRTVDPIRTILAWDGKAIDDDAVNYNGGKPGSYWGTEFDFGIEYRYRKLFQIVVEGAVLIPGQGLRDANSDAVLSWMLETRLMLTL